VIRNGSWRTFLIGGMVAYLVLAVTATFWPKGSVGFFVDAQTNTIIFIEPELVQSRVDLQIGDRLLMIYNLPWEDVLNRWNFFDLVPPPNTSIPIIIERQGVIRSIELVQLAPSIHFQVGKIINLILALCCGITGYKLGIRARHEGLVPSGIDIFWFGVSAVVGTHSLAGYGSLPLLVVLEWTMITLLVPYFVVMHTFFPYRPQTNAAIIKSEKYLLITFLLLNSIVVGVILFQKPSLIEFVDVLNHLLSSAILLGFISSSITLYRAYRKTVVIHILRQIRILISTYIGVTAIWFAILALPSIISETPIPSQFIHIVTIVIPLAYLISGTYPDLYRIDRMLLRILAYVIDIVVIMLLVRVFIDVVNVKDENIILWVSVYIIVLFYPLLRVIRYLFPIFQTRLIYNPLYNAMSELTTTLDSHLLTAAILEGLSKTFHRPAVAIYLRTTAESTLSCIHNDRVSDLPKNIPYGPLLELLNKSPVVMNSSKVRLLYPHQSIIGDESILVYHTQITLWCPIYHPQHRLIGLVVLGRRDDLDPYRPQDIYELQRLFISAALAYAHSSMYRQQVQSEQTIRHLFVALQRAQDDTARMIARELHDEIINVNIRLNIEDLQRIIDKSIDPHICDDLLTVMKSEQDTAQALRMICELLHPSGIDDPLGLPTILRGEIDRLHTLFSGVMRFYIENNPKPILPDIQREIMRITKEAIINAINHAQATEIEVILSYPVSVGDGLTLTIRDNGQQMTQIRDKVGHFGLRNMRERAQMIKGDLSIVQNPGYGTSVIISILYPDSIGSSQKLSEFSLEMNIRE
jgi:signal transduction histidine kinase